MESVKVAIVGGGISGLRTAQLLAKRLTNASLTLFEAKDSLGGFAQTRVENGFTIEEGPQTLLLSRDAVQSLNADIGHRISPREAKTPHTRYLIWQGRLLKMSPFDLLRSDLFSTKDLLKLTSELVVGASKPPSSPDETIAQFFERHFGQTFAETLVAGMCRGIWGGGANEIPVRYAFPLLATLDDEYGSVLRGLVSTQLEKLIKKQPRMPRSLISYPGGMRSLVQALHDEALALCAQRNNSFAVRLSAPARSVRHMENGKFRVDGEEFDVVFCCAPPWSSQLTLSNGEGENLWKTLTTVKRHSLLSVTLGGRAEQFKSGFGAVSTENEDALLGILFVHSFFPEYAKQNRFLFRFMFGGEFSASDEHLIREQKNFVSIAKEKLRELELVNPPVTFEIEDVILQLGAVPVPTVGHDKVLYAARKLENLMPGFYVTGNYLPGVGVPDTLKSAELAVEKYLATRQET